MKELDWKTIENLIPLLVVGGFFIAYFVFMGRLRKALAKLSACMKGGVIGFSFLPTFKGQYQGAKVDVRLIPQSRNSPSYLEIFLFKRSHFTLKITRENFFSKLGRGLGFIKEVKTHDPFFDGRFLVFSNKPPRAADYLTQVFVKEVIAEFFQRGFDVFRMDEKKLYIRKPRFILEQDVTPQNIGDILEKLIHLSAGQ